MSFPFHNIGAVQKYSRALESNPGGTNSVMGEVSKIQLPLTFS